MSKPHFEWYRGQMRDFSEAMLIIRSAFVKEVIKYLLFDRLQIPDSVDELRKQVDGAVLVQTTVQYSTDYCIDGAASMVFPSIYDI